MDFPLGRPVVEFMPWWVAALGLAAAGFLVGRRKGSQQSTIEPPPSAVDADEAQSLVQLVGDVGVGTFFVDRRTGEMLADEVAWEMVGGCVLDGVPRRIALRALWRHLPRADRAAWVTAWRDGLNSGLLRHDGRVSGLDGRERHLAVHAEIRAVGPRRMLGVCRDLTQMVETERELAGCRHQVLRVARVTHLGEMAAAIGHEMRQPLAKIRFSAESASSYLGTAPLMRAKIAELLADVAAGCAHAEAIIHRVHARTRREPLPFVRLDLNALVTAAVRDVRHAEAVAATTVVPDLQEDLPVVRGDSLGLRMLFANLILNAAEAMESVPPEQRVVWISTARVGPDEVRVTVVDSGSGISPEAYARLFLPFSTTKPTGTGMGLSLCRSIVTEHGGSITGFNRHDAPGAVFVVTLPVDFHDPDNTPPASESAADRFRGG